MTRPDARSRTGLAPHPLDLFSLTGGLVAVLAAGLYLLGELTDVTVEPGLVAAVVVVVLGLAGIVAAARRSAA